MKKKTLLFSLLAMFALVCAGGWYLLHQNQAQTVKAEARKTYIQSSRPTIFFHGWGSSSRAERHMANAAKKAGVTQTIIEAKVAEDGTVTLKGTIPKDAVNPIVLVNFDNAYAVVKALQDTYGIKEMNMVAHSYRNMAIVYYMLQHGSDTSLPKLVKQVDIAGHFNGIIGIDEPENITLDDEGKPSSMTES
mgnify:CR=1 FL=1